MSESLSFRGKVIFVSDIQSGVAVRTGKQWQAQQVVLEEDGRYPTRIAIELVNDNVRTCACQIGEIVEMFFDVNAREMKGRWYNDLRAYRCNHLYGPVATTPQQQRQNVQQEAPQNVQQAVPQQPNMQYNYAPLPQGQAPY